MSFESAKKVTMDDVARVAMVSKPTVSRALRGNSNVTQETRDKVLAVARELGYAVNRNAQKLRQKHTNTVAVILDLSAHPERRISDPFIFELLSGVSEALSRHKQDLLLSPSGLSDSESYRDLIRSRVVDGFLFLGQGNKEELLHELAGSNLPFVVWGGKTPDHAYCTVGSDNFHGGMIAGQRFVAQGRKNILFIGNSDYIEICQRRDGLIKGMEEADYPYDFSELKNIGFSFEDNHQLFERYLEQNPIPDGIFAFSDTAAIAAAKVLKSVNLASADDYSLIGYNDIPQASYNSPSITTIKQNTFLAGELIVENFMALRDGQEVTSSFLPTSLTIRET